MAKRKGRAKLPRHTPQPEKQPVVPQGHHWQSLIRQHFWKFGFAVVLVMVVVRSFSFTLVPPDFKGLYLTEPYYGLHSWAMASGAWAARSHVKYGLGYTHGYKTLVVGDPPPKNPPRYVNHPQLGSLIMALGMWIFGIHDWTPRLFAIITSIPVVLLFLFFLRRLFDATTALLAVFLLILFPLSAYFGFETWMAVLGLWALVRYLALTGQLPDAGKTKRRYYLDLAVALFLMVQLGWAGTFYAGAIGLHYVVLVLLRRLKFRAAVLVVLTLAPLTSLGLNFWVMDKGFEANPTKQTENKATIDQSPPPANSPIQKIINLFKWRASAAERGQFAWGPWFAKIGEYARSNFTLPVLVLLILYLGYYALIRIRRLISSNDRATRKSKPKTGNIPTAESDGSTSQAGNIAYDYRYLWFFLLPGVMLLLTLKGLVWEHQYWQRPFGLFVAIGTALAILTASRRLARLNQSLGKVFSVAIILLIVISCNRQLAAYRAVRWQSPRTIELFQKLHNQIPPGKALLTFKDFMIQQSKTKIPYYRPEYAWYLDREMVVARTPRQIQKLAATGRFPYYFIPAVDQPIGGSMLPVQTRRQLSKLNDKQLVEMMKNSRNAVAAWWERNRRLRLRVIDWMKKHYAYEYFDNPARPGEDNFCYRRNTPCYIFDLTKPKK